MELKSGYTTTDVEHPPKDWNTIELQSLVSNNTKYGIVDGPFGSNLKTIHYRKSGIPIISSGYVTEGFFDAHQYIYVDEEKFNQEKRSTVYPGDIVMAKIGARCGASAILPKNHEIGILSGNALKISVDQNRFSTFLVWQILWFLYKRGDFELLKSIGAQPAISMPALKKLKLALPQNVEEQNLIAQALEDTDAWIQNLTKLIEKKRHIKQGAMQTLLNPYENDCLKDGWEFKQLNNTAILKARIGWQGLTTDEYLISGEYFLVTGTDFKKGFIDWANCHYVDKCRFEQDRYIQLKQNDILLTKDGTIGKVAFIKNILKPATLNSGVFVIRPINNSFYPLFFYYILCSKIFNRFLSQLSAGSTISHLYQKDFGKFTYPIPLDRTEQIKIAEILSDIDREISELEKKLEKAKAIKQGMMQQLLTGRIRLV
ncbi:restriction endonuclease subunit S [Legionella pneumophila]